MDFDVLIQTIAEPLSKEHPYIFTSVWIFKQASLQRIIHPIPFPEFRICKKGYTPDLGLSA
jgi:hypothetical protein